MDNSTPAQQPLSAAVEHVVGVLGENAPEAFIHLLQRVSRIQRPATEDEWREFWNEDITHLTDVFGETHDEEAAVYLRTMLELLWHFCSKLGRELGRRQREEPR